MFPLYLSLKIAFLSTFIALVLGIVCAWVIVTWKNTWTQLLSIVTTIPLVLPPTVLGYYLLLLMGRQSWFGGIFESITGSPIVFTWYAGVVAATIAALPLLIRPIQASFESIDKEYIEAAAVYGANRKQIMWSIIIPLSIRGILAGIVLGFARAIGEFGATLMVAGNIPGRTQTLSIAIYDAVQADRMVEAHVMVIILTSITIGFLLLITKWLKT